MLSFPVSVQIRRRRNFNEVNRYGRDEYSTNYGRNKKKMGGRRKGKKRKYTTRTKKQTERRGEDGKRKKSRREDTIIHKDRFVPISIFPPFRMESDFRFPFTDFDESNHPAISYSCNNGQLLFYHRLDLIRGKISSVEREREREITPCIMRAMNRLQ